MKERVVLGEEHHHEGPTAAKPQLKRKSKFDDEGHEEHEVYNREYPNPSWPS
jgi:hypothetical protein